MTPQGRLHSSAIEFAAREHGGVRRHDCCQRQRRRQSRTHEWNRIRLRNIRRS